MVKLIYWLALMEAFEIFVKEGLIVILKNHFDSMTQNTLWKQMAFKRDVRKRTVVSKGNLTPAQWKILCPKDKKSDYKKWKDITLIIFVINIFPFSSSIQGYVNNARILRNKLSHNPDKFMTESQFDNGWYEIKNILQGLLGKDFKRNSNKRKEFDNFKTNLFSNQLAMTNLNRELASLKQRADQKDNEDKVKDERIVALEKKN